MISIVIVSWRVKKALADCLASIEKYSGETQVETIVVDNNSKDGTVEMIEEDFPEVKVIANDSNNGFAKACNQGLEISNGEYVFLLNPDTKVLPGSLKKLEAILYNNPSVGIVGPKILNRDGSIQKSVRRFPDLLSQILVLLKLVNINSNLKPLKNYLQKDFDYTTEQEVEQLMGAALMFRKDLIKKIGKLDERFYIWFEEIDYCYRTKKANLKVLYTPEASVVHQRGASFKQVLPLRRQLIFNTSLLKYFAKNVGLLQTIILALFVPINILLTIIYSFVPKNARTV